MKKLNIGKVIENLDGTPRMLIEDDKTTRPLTLRDIIVQLVPMIAEFDQKKALLRWDVATRILKHKEDAIELEGSEWTALKEGLAKAQSPDWVLVQLARAFEE